ncbi:Integrator complex subunit 2 [Coemansia sp. RSA 2603]|nr:Integrator complex subunit 2 [Coemansia sp. RSA 2603]
MPFHTGAVRRGEYSDQLLDSVPVSWILQCVGHDLQYRHLWPDLLSMATAQYSDQLDVVSELQREMATSASANSYRFDSRMANLPSGSYYPNICHTLAPSSGSVDFETMVSMANALVEQIRCEYVSEGVVDTQHLRHIIEEYLLLPISVRIETCGLLSGSICQAAMASVTDNELTACVRQVWLSLHAISPHVVSTATINAWRSGMEAAKPNLTAQDIWLDPLVIFRSDVRIFQSASLVDILLTVLGESLVLSRSTMRRIFTLRQTDSGSLKRSHMTAIIQLQESSALQMLIEIAKHVSDEKARWLVYEFIHARFLEQRTIQKLVHFQSYDIEAIRDMVDHVPSMHACSEFIPELLMQSAPQLQLFAIKLAAAITKKYPIQANEGMAREVILPHIQTTLVQIAGTAVENQLTISNAMLSAVIDIDTSFPLIHSECNRLATAVRDAAVEKARGIPQSQQKQLLPSFARWIGCCEHVLDIINSARTDQRPEFVSIDNTKTTNIMTKLEETVRIDTSSSQAGSQDSLKPPLSANGGGPPVPPGALRPPVPSSILQQQQPFGTTPVASQKRPHSMIGNERGPRAAPQREVGGQQNTDVSRNRNGTANGVVGQNYGIQPGPDSVAQASSGNNGGNGGGSVALPGGNPGAAGNSRRRHNRARNHPHHPREAGAGPDIGGVEGRPHPGFGNQSRRNRNSSTERPRITDH